MSLTPRKHNPSGLSPRDLGLPFDHYRPGQVELALDVASDSRRFSLVSAPTGAGKSLIYISIAKLLGVRTLVLTGTKGLQRQLERDFGAAGMVDIRGHGNYRCGDMAGGQFTARGLLRPDKGEAGGWCSGQRDPVTGLKDCDYQRAVERARDSQLVVSNYAYHLMRERANEPNLLGDFGLLVLDEAHRADDWLSRTCFWAVGYREAEDEGVVLPKGDTEEEWVAWARLHVNDYPRLAEVIRASELGVEWVVERSGSGVRLTPAWGWPWAEQSLFRGVPRVVLTSATLSRETGQYLGVEEEESGYWEADSPFSEERRPVIYMPSTRVDYRMGEGQKRLWINKLDNVIAERIKHNRKGIVHTVSYDRARDVVSRSRHSELMITHKSGGVNEAVEEFRSRTGAAILVSPALAEGYDFVGGAARWQIVCKLPFTYTKDPITQARLRSDGGKSYGLYLTAQTLVQMAGRIVRGPEDWGETVILDSHFEWFQHKAEFPGWFKRAWQIDRKPGGGEAIQVEEEVKSVG